jgi:cytochrome c553
MMKNLRTSLAAVVALNLGLLAGTAAFAQGVKGDVKAGEGKAAMCIGCHGIIGYQATFPEVYRVPMISGQGATYMVSALNAYKKGDRKHPTMRAISGSLSDQDMADLAAYYEQHGRSNLKTVAATAPTAPPPAVLKNATCVTCHGVDYNSPTDPANPKLAGQPADYLYVALKSYQVKNNPHVGRVNPVMGAMALPYSLAELKAIAAYISALPGDLKTVPQSKFR